jgi:hypothetical protein
MSACAETTCPEISGAENLRLGTMLAVPIFIDESNCGATGSADVNYFAKVRPASLSLPFFVTNKFSGAKFKCMLFDCVCKKLTISISSSAMHLMSISVGARSFIWGSVS